MPRKSPNMNPPSACSKRYLKAPDNPALATFAREQLPMLRSQVKDAARTMADK